MQYKVLWKTKALKQARSLPAKDHCRISEEVGKLSDSDTWHNVKPLVKHQYDYRMRVGNYRVLFNCENEVRIVRIEEVKKRDERTY